MYNIKLKLKKSGVAVCGSCGEDGLGYIWSCLAGLVLVMVMSGAADGLHSALI